MLHQVHWSTIKDWGNALLQSNSVNLALDIHVGMQSPVLLSQKQATAQE